jgi:membrane protein DedA with SNARE-associated domain/rhodanese-related sulfurtransferase
MRGAVGLQFHHATDHFDFMTQQLLAVLTEFGLTVVFLNVLLNQIGLPVPAVPTLIVAGALGAAGRLSLPGVFAASVTACLLADCGWYVIGLKYGMRVLKTLCRISLEPDSCVSETQSRFERWGVNSLVIAKFVPGLNTIAPPLAGALRIGWLRFLLLSGLAAGLWSAVALLLGVLLRSQVEALLATLDRLGSALALLALLLLAGYIAYKWWERSRFLRLLRMARISVAELYELMQAGAAPLVIDVRSLTARTLEPRSIPGARFVPIHDIATHLAQLPTDREIILYCTCPSEASAARVAKVLMNHGFKKVRPLSGGLDAWVAAGYAVVTTSR